MPGFLSPTDWCAEYARAESDDGGGDLVGVALQEEVAAVEQDDLRVRGVAPERLRAGFYAKISSLRPQIARTGTRLDRSQSCTAGYRARLLG